VLYIRAFITSLVSTFESYLKTTSRKGPVNIDECHVLVGWGRVSWSRVACLRDFECGW
jgi:hypothetical protein